MPYSWPEYFDWLHEKPLKWPQPPPIQPVSAQASIQPLPGIKVVLWDFYGTLVRISDGRLKRLVDDELRMQIAIEKTLEEFSMWQSMTRKPGAPWKYLLSQYRDLLEQLRMTTSCATGDSPMISLADIWSRILDRLLQKEFLWDKAIHGDRERLAQHIGFFYHLSLQGVEVNSEICETLITLKSQGVIQGILGETEEFSLPHFLWMVQDKTGNEVPAGLFDSSLSVMAHNLGLRKSSQTFYKTAEKKLSEQKILPHQVLSVSTRLEGDLEFARRRGWKTALLANDRLSLSATSGQLKEERLKPDRLLTSFRQVIDLLSH
jgi:FMN phosphatase YigB (HAD superfamily)